jgi:hypothetical protein
MTDEMIEALLAYCDDPATTTTSDAARLMRLIAWMGKVYCDLDAALARSGDETASTRTSNAVHLVWLAADMAALCSAHGTALAEKPGTAGLLAESISVIQYKALEVLEEVTDRLGLPKGWKYPSYYPSWFDSLRAMLEKMTDRLEIEEADEDTKRQMLMDVGSHLYWVDDDLEDDDWW